ncbi:MAG TPA: LUD domain-containing protein [Thermoplasmata archaeon]|nr:LUD domain-containing protein [Thermoplasmata archaeon]
MRAQTPSIPDSERLSPSERSRIERTFAAVRARGVEPAYARDRHAALAQVLARLPKGGLVSHGSSTTLLEIGLVDALKAPDSGFRYGNLEWQAEPDAAKRARLRARVTVDSDVFLGSVQAIAETGEVVSADAGGSRQLGYLFGPPKVLWVAGINKLVPTLADGLRRLRDIALPQEDARVRKIGGPGSYVGKLVVYERERPGRIHLILVGERLGF